MESTNALYQGIILEYNRAPLFYEKREAADVVLDAWNPVCGDKFRLYLDVEKERVTRATFHGYGCAVSKASISVLMKKIQGQSFPDIEALLKEFLSHFHDPAPVAATDDPDIGPFLPVRDFPARLKCVTQAWESLDGFIRPA